MREEVMARAAHKLLQLKVTLTGSKPPIWRRLIISNMVSLNQFHHVLQIAMGWESYHLHQFEAHGATYHEEDSESEFDLEDALDERKFKLHQLLDQEKDTITYTYDFGDDWKHKIVVEKVLPWDPNTPQPRVIKAKGACPPEDVGGIWGYYDFLAAVKDRKNPDHEEMLDWCGGKFDPNDYDLDLTNERLLHGIR